MFYYKENSAVDSIFSNVFSIIHVDDFYKREGDYHTGQFWEINRGKNKKSEIICQNVFTPLKVVREMVDTVFFDSDADENSKFLVFFNVEIVFSLVYNYSIELKNIVFFSDHDSKTNLVNSLFNGHLEIIINKEKLMSKKFDFIFGNPPYAGQSFLHQQIFNQSVDLVKDGGYVVFVQPASPYHNKKNKKNQHEIGMIENILKYRTSVKFHYGTVFETPTIGTDVAITTLQKTKSIPVINKVTYKNGESFEKVNIEDVSITEFPPSMYRSILNKFKQFCQKNGSIGDNTFLCPKKRGPEKNEFYPLPEGCAPIARYRGNTGKWDFFTIVSEKNKRENGFSEEKKTFGVYVLPEYVDNFYDYCESYVARIGLALFKFNKSLISGELNLVPMFDFSRTYTDEELYQMVGLTQEEIDAIEAFLPDFYGRKG